MINSRELMIPRVMPYQQPIQNFLEQVIWSWLIDK